MLLQTLLKRLLDCIQSYKVAFIVMQLIVLGLSCLQVSKLEFDNTPDSFFIDSDPNLINYENFKEQYDSDEFTLILLKAPETWDTMFINNIINLVEALEKLPHVSNVTSITNVRYIEGKKDEISIEGLFFKDTTHAEIQLLKQKVLNHPHYTGLYSTKDGSHVSIVVQSDIIKNQFDYKVALVDNIKKLVNQSSVITYQPRVVGSLVLDSDVRTLVQKESIILTLITFIVIVLDLMGSLDIYLDPYTLLIADIEL